MEQLSNQYLLPLQKWVKSLDRSIYFPPDRNDIACCGLGDHGHWSMQTNTTTLASLAILSQSEELDEKITGCSREELLETALKMLRFTLRSHKSGPDTALDGEKWGCHWISSLCIERMMHAIEAIDSFLNDADRHLLKNMLIAESNWLMDDYEVVGAIDNRTGQNHPESNIWNGSLLHRTATMYPDASRATEYREKGNSYLLNGISIPADAEDATIIDGKPISEWHIGPNYTENFGLHHHGYLNVGYMVICLSNIAMLHFSCKSKGIEAPAALYHHVPELWKMIKLCTFSDGRLWRIGGDTRVRYAYCQDYAIPMWLLMRDKYGEDCDTMEASWLKSAAKEQATNPDGSFMKGRLRELEEVSPLYYHRLEGDKAVTMSMGTYWRRKYNNFEEIRISENQAPLYGEWSDSFHGAVVAKGRNRAASWVWEAAQRPIGQCVPANSSNMAEWHWNMAGSIEGMGSFNEATRESNQEWTFPGGFCTIGSLIWISDNFIAEGQSKENTAREKIAVAALPDDATMIVLQRAKTLNRVVLKSVKGIHFNVPNDIFNNFTRRYKTASANFALTGLEAENKTLKTGSKIIEIDEKVNIAAIYGIEELCISRPGKRQVQLFGKPATQGRSGGNLYCDEICSPCITNRKSYDKDFTLFDLGFAVSIGNNPIITETVFTGNVDVKAVKTRGEDGQNYLIVANFATISESIEIAINISQVKALCGNQPTENSDKSVIDLPPHGMTVLSIL